MKKVFIVLLIVCGIIIIASAGNSGYKFNSKGTNEAIAYTSLRYSIAKAAAENGTNTLSMDHFNTLGRMVKNADSNNQWFPQSNKTVVYGNTGDTSDFEITWISDGKNCAIFYVENDGVNRYLVDYSFTNESINGYAIFVEN